MNITLRQALAISLSTIRRLLALTGSRPEEAPPAEADARAAAVPVGVTAERIAAADSDAIHAFVIERSRQAWLEQQA